MNWKETYCVLKAGRERIDESHAWYKLFSERHHETFDALLEAIKQEIESVTVTLPRANDEVLARLQSWRTGYDAIRTRERNFAESVFDALKRIQDYPNILEGPYHAASLLVSNGLGFWGTAPGWPKFRPDTLPDRGPKVYSAEQILELPIDTRDGTVWRTLRHLYRGVNSDRIPLIPPILRNFTEPAESVPPDELERRFDRLDAFRYYLRRHLKESAKFIGQADTGDAEIFELAFAQHFKAEARILTPMLDFTYDPLVALFFASMNGRVGDTGVIYCLFVESDLLLFAKLGLLGEVVLVDLPNVGRLRRQHGVLLQQSAPGAIEQLVPFELKFRQTGERYEDPDLDISENYLLAIEEEVECFVKSFNPGEGLPRKRMPSNDPAQLSIAIWTHLSKMHSPDELTAASAALMFVARFHHALQCDAHVPRYICSFRRLLDAAEAGIRAPSEPSNHAVFMSYVNHIFADRSELLARLRRIWDSMHDDSRREAELD